MVRHTNQKRKKERKRKRKRLKKINSKLRIPSHQELLDKDNINYFLSIDPSKTADKQQSNIGRGPTDWKTWEEKSKSDFFQTEIEWSRGGYVN